MFFDQRANVLLVLLSPLNVILTVINPQLRLRFMSDSSGNKWRQFWPYYHRITDAKLGLPFFFFISNSGKAFHVGSVWNLWKEAATMAHIRG